MRTGCALQHLVKVADLATHLAALQSRGLLVQPLLRLMLEQLQHSLLAHPKNCELLQACIHQLPISAPLPLPDCRNGPVM